MMIHQKSIARPWIARPVLSVASFVFVALLMTASSSEAQSPIPEPDLPLRSLLKSSTAIPNPDPTSVYLWQDKPLRQVEASIRPNAGELPSNFAATVLSKPGVLFDSIDDSRPWLIAKDFEWDAPATRHLPLFFEEANLERLGYTQRCYIDACDYETDPVVAEYIQPVISGLKFFGNVLTIPYKLGVQSPFEPIYTLGVDRPGSPVVYREHLIPLSLSGAILQAGVVCTLVFAIP